MQHCQPQAFNSHESDSPKSEDWFHSLLSSEPLNIPAWSFSLQKRRFLANRAETLTPLQASSSCDHNTTIKSHNPSNKLLGSAGPHTTTSPLTAPIFSPLAPKKTTRRAQTARVRAM